MNTQLFIKIRQILDSKFEGTIKTFENLISTFIVSKGADQEEISECNLYFDSKLPDDYKAFLKEFDGCTFFKIEDLAGFKFFGCFDLVKENKFQKENFGDKWDDNVILFCSCLGDGDYVGLKFLNHKSYEIVDCFMEDLPSSWRSIGYSFEDFVERLIDEKGRKFWLV